MDSTASPSEVAQLAPELQFPHGSWPDCKGLTHFYHPTLCIYCHNPVLIPTTTRALNLTVDMSRAMVSKVLSALSTKMAVLTFARWLFAYSGDPKDYLTNMKPCALLYCKDPHVGTWKLIWEITRDMDLSKYEDEGICWCKDSDIKVSHGLVTFHQECFMAINGPDLSTEKMDRMGRALFWTDIRRLDFSPHSRHYLLQIPDAQDYRHDSISSAGQIFGLSLDRLPLETLRHIQSYCRDAPFWKTVKYLDLATYMDMGPRTEMLSTSLANVLQWTRGSTSPVLSSADAIYGHMRITIDKQGFCEIDRLSEYPCVCLVKRPSKRFIILEAHHAENISASFKDGMCWLGLRNTHSISTIWDIPTPPSGLLSSCGTMVEVPGNRLETINLDDIGGLTLRFTLYGFEAKGYSKPAPLRQAMQWDSWQGTAYIPLASNDRILWMQVRRYSDHTSCIGVLVKTELSGIIHLGNHGGGLSEIIAFSESPRAIFQYPGGGNSAQQVVAIHPKSKSSLDHEVSELVNIGPPIPGVIPVYFDHTPIWSWASLQDIASVHVFNALGDGGFVGMHITYKNEGQRFVGDANRSAPYRISGCQPKEVRVENPTRLYVNAKMHLDYHEKVRFSIGDDDKLENSPQWTGYDIAGDLGFWELHFWCDPTGCSHRSKIQVLRSGSWRGEVE
ncbi:unnamed protein product [Fusarium venenatum]|uniref:Uncharacterized protein n=1 Tax=Fusarium venenatum TaxID=56646 RepID=A0A2L2TR01_9HYPO|nr:uncharacterized protein FVRRES_04009 [Fusarium venenatum]CEI67497.1 unnamed protein product [Fusarium venenatum]